MKTSWTLEDLETMKKDLLKKHLPPSVFEQLKSIDNTIDLLRQSNSNGSFTEADLIGGPSQQKAVIDAVLGLIDQKGHNVTNREILEYFSEKHIFVDGWKDKDSKLGAILWAEEKKDSGRVRKVKRGIWGKRREKQLVLGA